MAATVWKGRLAFGMVSIPVRLSKAARRERIRFHHLYRPVASRPASAGQTVEQDGGEAAEPEVAPPIPRVGELPGKPAPSLESAPEDAEYPAEPVARVRNLPVAEETRAPIEKSQMLKGYEIEKDRYVTLEAGEVAALKPETSSELSISEFVRLQEIDPVFFDTSYYAAPDRNGEKPYALLFRALADTGYAALGSLAMHGREHATLIRPGRTGLVLHTLFFEKEVRAEEEYPSDAALVSAKELDLAKMFVRALAAPFDATKLKDQFEERLRSLIDRRAATAVGTSRQPEAARPVPPVDILEALKKSLAMAKRPPKGETMAVPNRPVKARRKKAAGK
jgi:DNA end-binding protein Ku